MLSKAMYVLIVISALEILAIFVVVALCVAARRADSRTECMLSPDELEAHRRITDAPRRTALHVFARNAAARWLSRLF
jgi:hypothetical protein